MNWATITLLVFFSIGVLSKTYYLGKKRFDGFQYLIYLMIVCIELALIYFSGGLR